MMLAMTHRDVNLASAAADQGSRRQIGAIGPAVTVSATRGRHVMISVPMKSARLALLAVALAMTAGVASFLTYDARRAAAARTLGLNAFS